MANRSWKMLCQGPGPGLVLAVDFSTTGRPQAGFRDLAPRLDPPLTLWETLQPPAGEVAPSDYVDWWLAEIREIARPVRAVLGYCSGAVTAGQMVGRIATWQEEPRLLLLDPERPNALGLYRDFHMAGNSMANLLSPEELREFHAAGARVYERYGDGDLGAVGAALGEVFTAAIRTGAERLGLDDEIRDELAGLFDSMVRYLVAAAGFDPGSIWARSVAICSHDPGGAPVGRAITMHVEHHDLLRHDRTARVVSDLLADCS